MQSHEQKATTLTQAIIDGNDGEISNLLMDKNITQWISNHVSTKCLQRHRLPDFVTHTSALSRACHLSTLAIVRKVVEAGAQLYDINSNGYCALHSVCIRDREALDNAKFLVERDRGLLHARCNIDFMPIHWAAYKGITDVISYFIDQGVDVDATGGFNRTPVLEAALEGSIECIKLLVDKGANVHATNTYNRGLLHHAACTGQSSCIKMAMAEYQLDINAMSDVGSPLHIAAEHGNMDAVKTLCSYPDCDITLLNSEGETAAERAESKGHLRISQYLKELHPGKKYATDICTLMNNFNQWSEINTIPSLSHNAIIE